MRQISTITKSDLGNIDVSNSCQNVDYSTQYMYVGKTDYAAVKHTQGFTKHCCL